MLDNITKGAMFGEFKNLGDTALTMNHYELAALSDNFPSAEAWKEFLLDAATRDYISKEMEVIRKAQLNKLQKNAAESKSVGQAQLLAQMTKLEEASDNAERKGPVFIYCYVPLTDEQGFAPNVLEVDEYGHPKA